MKTAILLVVLIGLGGGGFVLYKEHEANNAPSSFRTAPVKRGDLLPTISASGPIEPEELVDVGAQATGIIKDLGIDPDDPNKTKRVDYRSTVHAGMVLAYIDDAVYKAQFDLAQANLLHAQADLKQYQARSVQTKLAWKRAEELHTVAGKPGATGPLANIKYISDADYEQAQADFEAAEANVAVAEATIKQNEAQLDLAKTNLSYTVIKSPVEGMIIDRRVNIGQTVVSNLSASSLFLIAKDLSKIQIWASVNEADIGHIRLGMPVRFTVDAYQGETFRGTVAQIRLNAATTQNVITYTVVVATDNSDRRLLPYMTANVQFEVEHLKSVLLVPNVALRWRPRLEEVAPDSRDEAQAILSPKKGKVGSSMGKAPADSKTAAGTSPPAKSGTADQSGKNPADSGPPAANAPAAGKLASGGAKSTDAAKSPHHTKHRIEKGYLWVKADSFVRPVQVEVGPTDGTDTEVSGPKLTEGMEVVLGEEHAEAASSDVTNPLAPNFHKK